MLLNFCLNFKIWVPWKFEYKKWKKKKLLKLQFHKQMKYFTTRNIDNHNNEFWLTVLFSKSKSTDNHVYLSNNGMVKNFRKCSKPLKNNAIIDIVPWVPYKAYMYQLLFLFGFNSILVDISVMKPIFLCQIFHISPILTNCVGIHYSSAYEIGALLCVVQWTQRKL